jgi:hypothetical protein
MKEEIQYAGITLSVARLTIACPFFDKPERLVNVAVVNRHTPRER